MIYLNPILFTKACSNHSNELQPIIRRRIGRKNNLTPNYIKKFLLANLDEILMGEPVELMKIHTLYQKLISGRKNRTKNKYNAFLEKIFNYKTFSKKDDKNYDAYNLAANLNIKTCAYCNRSYTVTVVNSAKNEKYTRPQFDHYFAKSHFPILALSFYNLVPSCSICNTTLKRDIEFKLTDYLHPYADNINSAFKFSYVPGNTATLKAAGSDLEVICVNEKTTDKSLADKIDKTFNLFKIKEIYSAHASEITDLIRIREVMSDKYLEILRKTYKLKITEDELYRLAFGAYKEEDKFQERPFSKLKKDILTELGII